MDPHDPTRISLSLDGELAPNEQERLEAHLAVCADCRATRDAFLKVRELLRAEAEPTRPGDRLAQRRALREILRARSAEPFWRRPVTLPAPGLAVLVGLLVLALGVLVSERMPNRRGGSESGAAPSVQAERPLPTIRKERTTPPAASDETSQAKAAAFDPLRFDRGGRLEIYVAEHPRDEGR